MKTRSRSAITPIALVVALSAGLLTACGTRHVSRDISPEGVAGDVIFPQADRAVLREGTFPSIEGLRSIGPGVTRDQLYQTLGRPHFREGLIAVREWDYLFHFRTPEGVQTCQYKVIFDQDYRGQSFHWMPASCASILNPPQVQPIPPPSAGEPSRTTISADALFAFGRYGAGDISPQGRREIEAFAAKIATLEGTSITVEGHTDRIGSDADNIELSQRRADTVRELLIASGVSAASIRALGLGKSRPVTTDCADSLGRSDLVRCLAPDRRVELITSARASR